MKELLNAVSVSSTFVLTVGLIYLILYHTIGRIQFLKQIKYITPILLSIAAVVIVVLLLSNIIHFYKPW